MMGASQITPTLTNSATTRNRINNRKKEHKRRLILPVPLSLPIEYTLDKVDGDKVWLLAVITGGNARELKERVFDLKRDSEVRVFMTSKDSYLSLDVLINKEEAK